MKFVLATTAIVTAMAFSPAFAQEADQQASPAPRAPEGSVLVEGIKPSKVLGAINTKKLVKPDESQPSEQAGPPLSIPEKTTSITTIETPPETAKPMVNIASVNVPLPKEVASVASTGTYSTKDLVDAQLVAMNNAPPIQQPVINTTTITYPNETASPPASAGQGDQPRTAEGSSGHSGDQAAPLPSSGASAPG